MSSDVRHKTIAFLSCNNSSKFDVIFPFIFSPLMDLETTLPPFLYFSKGELQYCFAFNNRSRYESNVPAPTFAPQTLFSTGIIVIG